MNSAVGKQVSSRTFFAFNTHGRVVKLFGEQIWFRNHFVNLSHRPKILELVLVFFRKPHRPRSLQDILIEICGERHLNNYSERYLKSLRGKILKNLQRLREILNAAFCPLDEHHHWVVYDRGTKTWSLLAELSIVPKVPLQKKLQHKRRENV